MTSARASSLDSRASRVLVFVVRDSLPSFKRSVETHPRREDGSQPQPRVLHVTAHQRLALGHCAAADGLPRTARQHSVARNIFSEGAAPARARRRREARPSGKPHAVDDGAVHGGRPPVHES